MICHNQDCFWTSIDFRSISAEDMALYLIWTVLLIITVPSAAENKIETGQNDKNLSSPNASDKNKTDISLKYEFKNALILNYTMLQKLRNAPSVGVAFFYSKRKFFFLLCFGFFAYMTIVCNILKYERYWSFHPLSEWG